MPLLERLNKENASRGFAVVTINTEPSENSAARELMQINGYTFLALAAPDAQWRLRYDVKAVPANILVDRNGRALLRPALNDSAARLVAEREIEALIAR